MKRNCRILIFILNFVLFHSCDSLFLDEGSYEYRGLVVDILNKAPISGVSCKMFIEDELHEEVITDSTGEFMLEWSGFINKNNARITFSKYSYKTIELHASMGNNEHFNDTVFMELIDVE